MTDSALCYSWARCSQKPDSDEALGWENPGHELKPGFVHLSGLLPPPCLPGRALARPERVWTTRCTLPQSRRIEPTSPERLNRPPPGAHFDSTPPPTTRPRASGEQDTSSRSGSSKIASAHYQGTEPSMSTNAPDGASSIVATRTATRTPSSTGLKASFVPISVRTHPGQTDVTEIP